MCFRMGSLSLRGHLLNPQSPATPTLHPLNAVKLALTLFRAICILTVAVMYLAYCRRQCPIVLYYREVQRTATEATFIVQSAPREGPPWQLHRGSLHS
jgi:hypothetical protein